MSDAISEDAARHASHRWPWKQFGHWGVTCIVLAVCVAFMFPSSAFAGTETLRDRIAATGALLVLGAVLLVLSRPTPGGARVPLLVCVGVMIFLLAAGIVRATWIGALFGLIVMHLAVAPFLHRAWIRFFPEEPERDEEATTDVIESIATAFVLALVVREFAFEAFKIPTGSMEPTIHGDQPPRSNVPFLSEMNPASWWKPSPSGRRGDRLLAAKVPLLFGEPPRFSIMVFKYPLFRPTNFIKRLVGLPGEHVDIRNGDVYVNGKVVAKPDEVQETLWFPLVPDSSGTWMGVGMKDAFTATDGGQWTFEPDAATGVAGASATTWIVHDCGQADVRASFDVDASKLGDGAVLVRLDGGRRRVELECRRDDVWLSAPGREKTKLDVAGLGTGESRIGFAVADRVVRVYRNGRLVARVETDDVSNAASLADQASIGVAGGTARVSKVRLEHDLQYSQGYGGTSWDIPAGCYVMLGDNTGASRDSRAWRARVFKFKSGAPPVYVDTERVRLDETSDPVQSLHDLGDAFDVFDSYGVRRIIKKDDLVGGTYTDESAPFVGTDDLVGRAFMTFFPFPPFGEWRPRLLP